MINSQMGAWINTFPAFLIGLETGLKSRFLEVCESKYSCSNWMFFYLAFKYSVIQFTSSPWMNTALRKMLFWRLNKNDTASNFSRFNFANPANEQQYNNRLIHNSRDMNFQVFPNKTGAKFPQKSNSSLVDTMLLWLKLTNYMELYPH